MAPVSMLICAHIRPSRALVSLTHAAPFSSILLTLGPDGIRYCHLSNNTIGVETDHKVVIASANLDLTAPGIRTTVSVPLTQGSSQVSENRRAHHLPERGCLNYKSTDVGSLS